MTALKLVTADLPTWEQVRSSYERGMLKLSDAVDAFAEMGDRLIALKDPNVTEHGEFLRKCAAIFYPEQCVGQMALTESYLNRTRIRAGKYMLLAACRNLWAPHHPKSMREAMIHARSTKVPLRPVVDMRRTPAFPTGERGKVVAQARKRRFTHSVSVIYGNVQGLENFDFLSILAAFDDKEIRLWVKQLRTCGTTLSKLARKLASLQTQKLPPLISEEKPST